MQNRDWEQLGENIRKTVQEAIDSQDFNQLNQTINNTINGAAHSFHSGIRTVSRNVANQYYENRSFQDRQQPPKTISVSNLYVKTTAKKVGAIFMIVLGSIFGTIAGATILTRTIVALLLGSFPMGFLFTCICMTVLLAASVVVLGNGVSNIGKVNRFSLYLEQVRETGYCDIKRLCEVTGASSKKVLKDLNEMIARRWFLEGHLDEQRTCLITNDEMYQKYQSMMESRRQSAEAEQIKKESEVKQQESMSPEVKEVLKAGNEYISKIHACNDAIPGTEISAKIARMEELVHRIFDRVEMDPSSVSNLHKMMNYYLPTTIKLLEAYEDLDSQPIQGDNILSSKREIEKTLDTLNIAFEKLLDDLFEHTAWDVSSDISVLNTMLAQEGLKKNDFELNNNAVDTDER